MHGELKRASLYEPVFKDVAVARSMARALQDHGPRKTARAVFRESPIHLICRKEEPADGHDLDQVGLVVTDWNNSTTVAGIARKNGTTTVTDVRPGDKLLKIDDLDTASATRGQILQALHGRPGYVRHLLLERNGRQILVDSRVTGF
jgi:C-terminal processing protease CtpA/Prc